VNEGKFCGCVVFIYENRILKYVEIVLRKWEGRRRRTIEGVNIMQIYFKHMSKCQNIFPLYNYHVLIKKEMT
jgi:hypothetical protein